MDNSDVEDIDLMPKLVANDEPIIETENHEEAEEQILQQELDEIPEDEVLGHLKSAMRRSSFQSQSKLKNRRFRRKNRIRKLKRKKQRG